MVSVSVTANGGTDARTGTLTIAGQSVAVTQKGGTAACTYDLTPASAAFSKDAATGSFSVAAPGACSWRATASDGWISISAPAGDASGNGTVSYAVSRNTGVGGRNGTISVGGRTFQITQSGDAGLCEYRVSPVEFSPCMAATQITTSITTDAACAWTITPDASWLSVAGAASGRGSATVTVTVGSNWDAPRLGLLLVRWDTPTLGQNVRVAQAGCRYAVSAASINVVAGGGPAQFSVYQQSDPLTCGGPLQNGCMWSAEPDVPWITVNTSMPQFGDNPVSLTILPNTTGSARSGSVRVRDQVVRITQAGS